MQPTVVDPSIFTLRYQRFDAMNYEPITIPYDEIDKNAIYACLLEFIGFDIEADDLSIHRESAHISGDELDILYHCIDKKDHKNCTLILDNGDKINPEIIDAVISLENTSTRGIVTRIINFIKIIFRRFINDINICGKRA